MILRIVITLFGIVGLIFTQEAHYKQELIFPLQKLHCHGSSIITIEDKLLVCWFYGSGERKADDVAIVASYKEENHWKQPFVLADTPGFPDCNPVLSIDPRGKLWLFWTVVLDNRWQSSLLKYKYTDSFKNSISWQWQGNIHIKPQKNFNNILNAGLDKFIKKYPQYAPDLEQKTLQELSADEEMYYYIKKKGNDKLQQRLGWMTRIHPLWLPSGKMLLPLYTDAYSVSIIAITSDYGQHWSTSHPIVGYGNIQPSLVQKKDKSIVAMMRENGPEHRIRLSTSSDGGVTWGTVENMEFLNPGSSVECLSLKNGNWILVYNDTYDGRHQLKVSLSDDEGKSWKWHKYLEKQQGRFSYPSIAQDNKNNIHITYSYHVKEKGKSIKHVEFNEVWLKSK
ncbi:exo-alpha-sialidase [Candidatus Uabimicrobium sp. HlEnr_7]|uniref:sialidase family protein n=1 Tax=Candidatus Uabimicrobium helgolandensis TaxID=3095367 RepID=UPI0035582DCA